VADRGVRAGRRHLHVNAVETTKIHLQYEHTYMPTIVEASGIIPRLTQQLEVSIEPQPGNTTFARSGGASASPGFQKWSRLDNVDQRSEQCVSRSTTQNVNGVS
jgi:hypothetical protein